MLLDLIGGFDAANPMVTVLELAQLLIIVLLTLTVHEVAHGWAAKKLGDDTAERQGRLSLNPVNHLDPIGFLCMLIAGFGWAKPVPINARRFKNPKLGMAISALAGPLSNLLMAFAAVIPMELLFYYLMSDAAVTASDFAVKLAAVTLSFLLTFHYMNITLAIFNFLPIPPLDGSRVLYSVLPDKLYFGVMKYERTISLAIMLMLFLGVLDFPLSWLSEKISYGMQWLVPIEKIILRF